MNYACPSWNMDSHFKFDSVLHNKITHSVRKNCTVDNWADSKPLIKAFTLNNAKRIMVRFSIESMMPSTGQQTGTTEIGKLRTTHYLQQHNQSSVFTLPSTIAHSRREPRRIVTRWWRLHGLCVWQRAARSHPFSRRVITWSTTIIAQSRRSGPCLLNYKNVRKRPMGMFLPEKNSETMFAGIGAI